VFEGVGKVNDGAYKWWLAKNAELLYWSNFLWSHIEHEKLLQFELYFTRKLECILPTAICTLHHTLHQTQEGMAASKAELFQTLQRHHQQLSVKPDI